MRDAFLGSTAAAAPLQERSDQLMAIEALLAAAHGGSGSCLVLEGGAGLGKSRLATEAAARAASESITVLRARGAELERDFTFGVVLQLFEPLLVAAGAGRKTLMAGPAALCAPLFATAGHVPHASADSEFPLLHGLHWLAANVAERSPLLLVVDDAHWADLASLRFLVYLLQRLDEMPIAVLVTARPTGPEAQRKLVARVARHQHTTVQELDPLSTEAVATLVRAELDANADDELCEACAAATGGNPFYVRELIEALREHGASRAGDVPALDIGSAGAAVLRRIAALPAPAAALASAVAVLGDGAPLERAAMLAGIGFDEAAAAADALAGAAVLQPGARLSFVHPIVLDAVYSALPDARRARAHASAAELLNGSGADAELVAVHLVQAHGTAGEWAVAALRRAARLARERGAPAAAARYLREAVASLEREPDRGALLTELALAEAKAREDGALDRAKEAIDALADPRERAAAALAIGMVFVDGAQPEAATIFTRGLEELSGAAGGDDELAMTLRSARATIGFGHAATAPGDLQAILERAAAATATPAERLMLAHGALANGLRGQAIDELRRLARASLNGPPPNPADPTDMAACSLAATALLMAGDLTEAERALTPALDGAREGGSVLGFGTLSHIRAHALYRHGRLDDAIADAQSALDVVRYGWKPELPAIHAVLALCLIERAELAAAEAAIDVPGGEERWGEAFTWADLLDARGRLRLARGDARGALADLLACGERLKPLGASHSGVVPWRPGAALAALRLGDAELAGRLAAEDTELARAFGAPRELGIALRTAGRVAGGDRGIGLLRESVAVLRDSEAVLELAHSLSDLGAALLQQRHRLAARESLAEALDLAHACRADAVEETARERLLATGARPRRASVRGSDALTPRERRIAQMAVEGGANREIAAALFITTKTVETHLGRAYRKLGITGRAELAEALRD